MKLEASKNSHKTNAPGESHDFQIGDAGVIIEILRNRLYRYPIRTLVQEYISNARDAVREAGLPDNKLIITAPTVDNPSFSVRDFGNGISPERIKNVFVFYGSSTKRDSNQQVGGFGIGAKSAWAYADSFTITTRIDGVQRQYLAHVGSKNQGVLEFISESQTSEENGTEVTIPVRSNDIPYFHSAIQRCVYFWETLPTLMNLKDDPWFKIKPTINQDGITMLADFENRDYRVFDSSYRLLVVDGIPYAVQGLEDIKFRNCLVAIHCKTGDVEVSASRESLSDSAENRKIIENIVSDVNQKIEKMMIDDCTKQQDIKSYIKKISFWHQYTGSVSGVPSKFDVSVDRRSNLCFKDEPLVGIRWSKQSSNKLSTSNERAVCFEDLEKTPLFIKIDKEIGRSSSSSRIKQVLDVAGLKFAFGFKNGLPDEIFDYKLSEIKINRKPKTTTTHSTPVQTQIHNLQRYNGYRFDSFYEDFSKLSTNPNNFIYVDLEIDKFPINRYLELAKICNRILVGVGAKAKKAIIEAKKTYPSKFLTPDEIESDPKKHLGEHYKKVTLVSQRQCALDKRDQNINTLLNFLDLPHMTESLNKIEDEVFRENFIKLGNIFSNRTDQYGLPQNLVEVILNLEPEIKKEIELAKLLGELIEGRLPFISITNKYSWTKRYSECVISTLNVLIAAEAKK